MSFEYIVEKENGIKTVSKNLESEIVKQISDDYSKYNNARSSNLSKSDAIINEIFFKKNYSNTSDKNEKWKSKVKMCKCYMFYQTLKAFIWKNIYSNVHSMFDVSGENHDSDNQSNKQKAVLVDMLEKMDYQKTCDSVIDNALIYGELISFTAWKKKYEEYRRPISFFKNLFSKNLSKLPEILKAAKSGKKYWIDSKKVYDNPYIYPINPADLVFDVTQVDNWDSCPKIYRSFKTPDDIINNKLYSIDKETALNIRQLLSSEVSADIRSQSKDNLKDEIVNGSTVEILEHWGDFRMPSGEILKNWHAVVVGRKYLVKFQKNDSIINPFTYGALIVDPETKRGISPLYCILSLANSQEGFLNRTVDMQALSENPPLLAPEGFFDEEEIALYPGKIIEYGDNLSSVSAFKQLTFNSNIFLNDIEFLDSLMCEVSGIYPSMIGIQENSTKTATEINTKTQGQLTRLSMMLDIINQYFIIPDIKNVARLAANFKHGKETVYVNQDNNQETVVIDDDIRQADYKYTYSDRNVINEKSESADLVIQAVEKFSQLIPLDVAEIFTWYFEQKGVENPERFLEQQQLELQKQATTLQNNQMLMLLKQSQSQLAQQPANPEQITENQLPVANEQTSQTMQQPIPAEQNQDINRQLLLQAQQQGAIDASRQMAQPEQVKSEELRPQNISTQLTQAASAPSQRTAMTAQPAQAVVSQGAEVQLPQTNPELDESNILQSILQAIKSGQPVTTEMLQTMTMLGARHAAKQQKQ